LPPCLQLLNTLPLPLKALAGFVDALCRIRQVAGREGHGITVGTMDMSPSRVLVQPCLT
jgi:hypothetical protein